MVRRIPPWVGAMLFAALFFFARLGADWLFRWAIAGAPMPPFWSVLLTIGFGTAISTTVVYFLLRALHAQDRALDELNHELRNSLQVLAYIIPSCDPAMADQARSALERMTRTVSRVSEQLGYEPLPDHPRRKGPQVGSR